MTADDTLAERRAEAERIIAEASALPVKDAAFFIWRQQSLLDKALLPPEELASARAALATIRYDRERAQDGPEFDRLKLAHPQASDRELKEAVTAAATFDADCFKHFRNAARSWTAATFWGHVERAVARAAEDHPGYLETTYRDARNWVAYHEK
jgi:hypothetical protein